METNGHHILLYEKEKGLQRIMTLIFKQAGFRVTPMSSIETILDRLAANEHRTGKNILVFDLSTANESDKQIFKKLRENATGLQVVIIGPYEYSSTDYGHADLNSHQILTTPFSPEELLECINNFS